MDGKFSAPLHWTFSQDAESLWIAKSKSQSWLFQNAFIQKKHPLTYRPVFIIKCELKDYRVLGRDPRECWAHGTELIN